MNEMFDFQKRVVKAIMDCELQPPVIPLSGRPAPEIPLFIPIQTQEQRDELKRRFFGVSPESPE